MLSGARFDPRTASDADLDWRAERGATRLGRNSAAALMDEVLPEIRYIIPGYIAEGLTLIGGKPKLGKSWLTLGWAIAVAMGGCAMGTIEVEQGDVLCLALEDNKRRLQSRLNQLLPNGTKPERLFYDLTCRRLGEGLIEDLRAWIESVDNPRLIIIDVLNKVRPPQKPNEGIYDYDVRCLEGLQGLAAEFGIAIVVVHHTRKAEADDPFDCLSGSTGLTGTADTTLILARDSQGTTLYGRGRDIDEIETAMSFDRTTGHWTAMGAAPEVRMTDERTTLLNALKAARGPLGPTDLAAASDMSNVNVRRLLLKMVEAGTIERAGYGRYVHPDFANAPQPPGNTGNSGHSSYRRARDGEGDDDD